MKDLYTENYRIPMREIEEDTNKGKDILYKFSWVISMDFLTPLPYFIVTLLSSFWLVALLDSLTFTGPFTF